VEGILGRWGYFFAGALALAAIVLFNLFSNPGQTIRAKPTYNELLDKINDGSIAHASIKGNMVIATTKTGQIFDVWVFSPEKMVEKMVEKGIRVYTGGEEGLPPSLLGVFINWLPLIIFWFAIGVPLYSIRATLRRLEQAAKKE
jgi:ATP-dependent Zn protease